MSRTDAIQLVAVDQKDSQLTACARQLVELMHHDEKILVLAAELATSCKLQPVAEAYPERLINVGIAEQNLVSLAAGLASEGYRPYIYSFATFLSMRACEQLRTDVFYNQQNIKIMGTHSGFSTGPAGPTHYSLEDVGIIRSMPESRVIVPSDTRSAAKTLVEVHEHEWPVYIRLDRNPPADVYDSELAVSRFNPLGVNILREGTDAFIFCSGTVVHDALTAAEQLAESGLDVGVIDLPTVKPLDTEGVERVLRTVKYCMSVEIHNLYGGIGSTLSEVIATRGIDCRLTMIGIDDSYPKGGPVDEIKKALMLDETGLKQRVSEGIRKGEYRNEA